MSLPRRLVERASRRVVLKRKLPRDLLSLTLWVTPAASLRYWGPGLTRVDPGLLEAARVFVRPGMAVWDVGASVGLFSFAAAALAGASGEVTAFEPDPFLAELLRRSRSALPAYPANVGRVEVIEAAVSDTDGYAELMMSSRSSSLNQLGGGRSAIARGFATRRVRVRTLDACLKEGRRPPDLIKIDVEGLEQAVISGGLEILIEQRPVILCETIPPASEQVSRLLHQHGYELFDASVPAHLVPTQEAGWATAAIWPEG